MKKKGLLAAVTAVSLILVLALALPLATGCAKPGPEPEKMYRIGESVIIEHPDLKSDSEGFAKAMAEAGFVEGENVEYIRLCAEGDMSIAKSIADRFVAEKVDLVHAITTPNAQACVAAAEGTGIPIVFSSVTAPALAGIVSTWDAPRPDNVTGISDMIDIKGQMQMIRDICPDFKILGTVYNAGEVNSCQQVDELKGLMSEMGIEKVVEANCSTTADVFTAAKSLVGRCDVIWIPSDNTAVSGLESIVGLCEEHQIPLFGSTAEFPPRGCIAGPATDYTVVGYLAGQYAARVLLGEFPGDIPVIMGAGGEGVVVNPAAAERMGVTIPQAVIDKAAEVITE